MARQRKMWRFRTGDSTIVEVSAAPDATRTQIRRRGRWSLVVGMLLAILAVGAVMASADTVVTDGDGVTPVSSSTLSFGTVACSTSVTKTALIAINRNGAAGSTNVFKDGSSVTVTVVSTSASDLSASMAADNSLTLPSNWGTDANNTVSSNVSSDGYVSSTVTINSSTAGAGTGSVTYRATGVNSSNASITRDGTLNVSWTTDTCTVPDSTPPALTLPSNITTEATSASGAVVTYTATANDNVDGAITPTCSPVSGSTFALGTTTVTCSATDTHNNTGSGSFTVTVVDTTAPSLTLPADITAEATGPSGVVVTYSASASDLVDGSVSVTCVPASGATFALGTTTVNCSATDAHGNKATGSFLVGVVDTTPPSLTLPSNITKEATGPTGASATWTASATDLVDGSVAVTCDANSGDTFPLGTTTVHCSATDAAGNKATGSFTVTVQDTTPPSLTLPSNITAAATSSAGAVVTFTASASDVVDGAITPSCTPASGSTFVPGTTTVNCSATDAHGNKATGSFTVTVSFNFIGFLQPVDNKMLNGMKAGSTAPIKWQVSDGSGGFISDLSIVKSESSGTMLCDASTPVDTLEQTATGGTSLRYDFTNNQFVYNWQSPKQPGKCFDVRITLTDGSQHDALFTLK